MMQRKNIEESLMAYDCHSVSIPLVQGKMHL
jgi:hypothetical protein